MKGIILAGGKATRLRPLTLVTSKQLLPVYDKPMIYYPMNTLLQAGIKEILIIVAPEYAGHFLHLLGSGKKFNCDFSYEIQEEPKGLADAFIVGEKFIGTDDVALILGDNIFDYNFSEDVKSFESGARVFAKKVHDPERYGVVKFNEKMTAEKIVEKPREWISDFAVTGFYLYDNRVIEVAKNLKPSDRGEIEITDVNNWYLNKNELDVKIVDGIWEDAGTFESLFRANKFWAEKSIQK